MIRLIDYKKNFYSLAWQTVTHDTYYPNGYYPNDYIRWGLVHVGREPPAIDEALSLEYDERCLVNAYLLSLRRYLRRVDGIIKW